MKKLTEIQQKLKAPKNQFNGFGKYKYRSCEDILTAVKPLLNDCRLVMSDEMVMLGDRFYVKATVGFYDGQTSINVSAYAREALTKKGMDESQITGTASSYARKYALNGLFLIDDTKDADSGEHQAENDSRPAQQAQPEKKPTEQKKDSPPYWMNEFKDKRYIFATLGEHFDADLLKPMEFRPTKKDKGIHFVIWTQDIENLLKEQYEAVESLRGDVGGEPDEVDE